MATIQRKKSHGQFYWYIVESRRVNGKPRPVVLAYLGKAEDLLQRLQSLSENRQIKSFSHGAVAALLQIAHTLDIPSLINQYVHSTRPYMAPKPLRNQLTVGATLLLGAIGRVCMMTSKRGWWEWAKTTSCEHLLRCNLSQIDSQHFWDLMDALPVEAIESIEHELLQRVFKHFEIPVDTLFYDTTNFFTYIATPNTRCTIAQRGKNKQKRNDLRQIGLALVVTRENSIPLFHLTYEGNRHDSVVFQRVNQRIKQRLLDLGLDITRHTLVFDRGNNSKENFQTLTQLQLHYVAALTPYQHKSLVNEAIPRLEAILINDHPVPVYREQRIIWGEPRTVVVYRSSTLQEGQQRGLRQELKKKTAALQKLQNQLQNYSSKPGDRKELEWKIRNLVKGQFLNQVIDWSLKEEPAGRWLLDFSVNEKLLAKTEENLGIRILITDRHDWSTEEIIEAYHGQAHIERAFKNLKNPYHLTLKPQFHWTDQKIKVHYFMGVLGYLLATLVWYSVRKKMEFNASLDTLLDQLNNIRLAMVLDKMPGKRGKAKVTYQLEKMSPHENDLIDSLEIRETHSKRIPLNGFSVYNDQAT